MLLKIENASFEYRQGQPIISSLSFEVSNGEILAILGPNGAGKTTLLRCITGMLEWGSGRTLISSKNQADKNLSSEQAVHGNLIDISKLSLRSLWQRMAYVPQARSARGIGTGTSATALQTILLGRSSRINVFSSPKQSDIAAAESAMHRLGIENLSSKPCNELSGGEYQMVLIARAIASEPELLILDEPESNLDFRNQLIVLDTITELASDGMACIFNTHYPSHALSRADKSILMRRGSDCLYGRASEVVTEENIKQAFGVNARIITVDEARETQALQPTHAIAPNIVVPLSIAKTGDGQDSPASEE